ATAGIGSEFARQLAPFASQLILVGRRVERLEAMKSELKTSNPSLEVWTYGIDLADEEAVEKFCAWLAENKLEVDVLINNAGLGDRGFFHSAQWPKIREILKVNIVALTQITHRLLPAMKTKPHAIIINVSSVAGLLPLPGYAVYAASKAYVT